MNGIKFGIWLFMLFALAACSSGSDGGSTETASSELQMGETRQAHIDNDKDVDIYTIRANEVNRYLQVSCVERTSGSYVDLMVTVYEVIDGKRVRKFGKHKAEGAGSSADLKLWVYIREATDLIIEVKDLMADNSNKEIPYFLTCSYQDSIDGNHDFSTAQELPIGAQGAITDAIAKSGEVDCFTFNPTSNGVYALSVDHNKPNGQSDVQLAVKLFDAEGNRIMKVADPDSTILAYLETANGPYNVAVEDSDSKDGDAAATYEISVVPVTANETNGNDTKDSATGIGANGDDAYVMQGAIEYASTSVPPSEGGDKDWYSFTVGEAGGSTTYHPLQMTIDDGSADNGSATLRVTVYKEGQKDPIAFHDFVAGTDAYTNQIRVPNGQYYVLVEPAGANKLTQSTAYDVQLTPVEISDAREPSDDNTINSAENILEAPHGEEEYISYISDVDWYYIDVDPNADQVISVNLNSAASSVDYHVSIYRGTELLAKVDDQNGSDGATHLKTSVLIPAGSSGATRYEIRVADAQGNDGSPVPYTLTAKVDNLDAVPSTTPGFGVSTPIYYKETVQEAAAEREVELEVFSNLKPKHKYNTNLVNFRDAAFTTNGGTITPQAGDTTVITTPWVSGYIDYQNDRDFFQLDFDKLDPNGTETEWYYDVEVKLVVPGRTTLEHVWKLYLDHNQNEIIRDQPSPFDQESQLRNDYYKACAGDTTPGVVNDNLNITTPDPNNADEEFWIGSRQSEGAKYFFAVSDFDYWKLPSSDPNANPDDAPDNPNPDADWSYEDDSPQPYYFKITMTYHPGKARPDAE